MRGAWAGGLSANGILCNVMVPFVRTRLLRCCRRNDLYSRSALTMGGRPCATRRLFPSAPLPKFVVHRRTVLHELRKQRGTSGYMIVVPPFDLKFLHELAATAVGTSNRRHYRD